MKRLFLPTLSWLSLLFLSHVPSLVLAAPCTVCPGGEDITLPDKELSIPGFEFINTCGALNATIPSLLDDSLPECGQLQSVGTICGCPIPPNACHLCNGDPTAVVQNRTNPIPLFPDLLPGNIVPDCEIVQANMQGAVQNNDPLCSTSQIFLADYCQCSNVDPLPPTRGPCEMCPSGNGVSDRNRTIDLFGFTSCGELDDAVRLLLREETEECDLVQSIVGLCGCDTLPTNPCTMCRDGSSVPEDLLNREMPFLDGGSGGGAGPFALLQGIVPTCSLYQAYLLSLDANDETCQLAQGMGSYCGCAPVENHCAFCEDHPIDPLFYNKTLNFLSAVEEAGVSPTCEFTETLLKQVPTSDRVQCYGIQQRAFLCGCNDGVWMYSDASNEAEKTAIAWAPRVSGALSLLGALAIIVDVLSSAERRSRVYTQLVFGMAMFDLITAVPWIIGSIAVPAYVDGGDPSGVLGAVGNDASCKAQGFFIELGQGSFFYNISLALFYKLVIVNRWKEARLRKIRFWMHAFPIVLGLALAFGGLPYYTWTPSFCIIPYFPLEDNLIKVLWLLVIPFSVTLLALSVLMLQVYLTVRKQYRKSSGNRHNATVQEKVFWQSVSYLLAFLISWPIVLVGAIRVGQTGFLPYAFGMTLVILGPLQGFINSVVYFRPRFGGWFEQLIGLDFTGVAGAQKSQGSKASASEQAAGTEPADVLGERSKGSNRVRSIVDPSLVIANEDDEDEEEEEEEGEDVEVKTDTVLDGIE